ncbi:MAG TPA: serine/threonine-protein kinase [Pirellulales bacterium]|nr:serine/threonine-protein kinase [Pirellulales bacterium]
MVSRRNHFECDHASLRLALDDRLVGEAHEQLATHLEQCEDCRTHLEALSAGRDWWQKAQSHLSSGDAAAAGEPAMPSDTDGPWLGFLLPIDDERYLGRFGEYLVTEVIGSGGFGVVLKALDPALNRHVAIKVLSPQLANNGSARRRFAREAQAAAAVVHEHVVAIHSVSEHEGLPYLVMSYVPGCSLQDRLDRQGPLETREVLRIGMQTAAGLAAAHAQGLVHRDIKPANILLENGVERVKITDFGLARTIDDASLTASGIIAGTPQYMAPEQARGETVDHRSDLFSLGSVLYAMCTGHSPFRAETFMAVWRRLCIDTPRPVRETNPEVPEWLAEIIEKLHSKQPHDRIQSAGEVAELLAAHLAHLQRPNVAPKPARLSVRRRGWRRWSRRASWITLGVLTGVVIAALAWRVPGGAAGIGTSSGTEPRVAAGTAIVSTEAAAITQVSTPPADLRLADMDGELARAEAQVKQLESELGQPASSLGDASNESIVRLDAELQQLERQFDNGP